MVLRVLGQDCRKRRQPFVRLRLWPEATNSGSSIALTRRIVESAVCRMFAAGVAGGHEQPLPGSSGPGPLNSSPKARRAETGVCLWQLPKSFGLLVAVDCLEVFDLKECSPVSALRAWGCWEQGVRGFTAPARAVGGLRPQSAHWVMRRQDDQEAG